VPEKGEPAALGSLAATATATFALTAGMVSLAMWWNRHSGAPQSVQSQLPAVESTPNARAQQGPPFTKGAKTGALAQGRSRGSSWTTYQNTRFGFALKYPADVFASVAGPANDNGRTLVSHDGAPPCIFLPP
jgi:hypothetical protein